MKKINPWKMLPPAKLSSLSQNMPHRSALELTKPDGTYGQNLSQELSAPIVYKPASLGSLESVFNKGECSDSSQAPTPHSEVIWCLGWESYYELFTGQIFRFTRSWSIAGFRLWYFYTIWQVIGATANTISLWYCMSATLGMDRSGCTQQSRQQNLEHMQCPPAPLRNPTLADGGHGAKDATDSGCMHPGKEGSVSIQEPASQLYRSTAGSTLTEVNRIPYDNFFNENLLLKESCHPLCQTISRIWGSLIWWEHPQQCVKVNKKHWKLQWQVICAVNFIIS